MHNCVTCDGACYCHGDIDDCQVETEEYAYENCTGCGCKEDGLEGFADGDMCWPPELWPDDQPTPAEIHAALEEAGQMRLLP